MSDMGEVWKAYREEQQARRSQRLGPRTQEILDLRRAGFSVKAMSEYQLRVDGRLDLYPIHRRWHDVASGKRGKYSTAKEIAIRTLKVVT